MRRQRRAFLKLAAVGVTGVTFIRAKLARAAWPKTGTMNINPNISNTLVVACKDDAMVKNTPASMTFAAQTSAVDSARVAANLDAMAMRLANTATADDAWKAIFRSSKPWASTRVAIKINVTESKNMPRLAVVEKLCRVIAGLGVPAANIIVYDGGPESFASATSNYAPYFSTSDSSKIPGVVSKLNDSLGGTTNAPLPDGTTASCTADVANGKIDILVNIAINKGHIYYGKASLCMKNHYGTFLANHDANYLFTINKSDAIVGGNPPRQQLCIVDSLFAIKTYNNAPDTMPCYLVMGTFAPIVDYLTVKKVREEVLKYSHDSSIIDTYPTTFGYTAQDPQWVLVSPGSVASDAGVGGAGGSGAGGSTSAVGGRTGAGGNTATGGATGGGGRTQPAGTGGRTAGAGGSTASGSGGASGPATTSSGGTGAAGPGGRGGTGGASGFGGTTTVAPTGGTGGGAGGGMASSGGQASSGSGGTSAVGGASSTASNAGGAGGKSNAGCGCRLGEGRGGFPGMGMTAVVGTWLAAKLGRLLLRREELLEQRKRRVAAEGDGSEVVDANAPQRTAVFLGPGRHAHACAGGVAVEEVEQRGACHAADGWVVR
jgi:hypothetical protein